MVRGDRRCLDGFIRDVCGRHYLLPLRNALICGQVSMAQPHQSTVGRVAEAVYCALMETHESVLVTQTVGWRRRCKRKAALKNIKRVGPLGCTGRSCFRPLEECREIIESARASMCVVQSNARLFACKSITFK